MLKNGFLLSLSRIKLKHLARKHPWSGPSCIYQVQGKLPRSHQKVAPTGQQDTVKRMRLQISKPGPFFSQLSDNCSQMLFSGSNKESGGIFLLPVNLPFGLWDWLWLWFGSAVSGGSHESGLWSWPLHIQLLLPSHLNGALSLSRIETHNLIITG